MYIKNYVRLPFIVLRVFHISFCFVDIFTIIFILKVRRYSNVEITKRNANDRRECFFFFACFCNSHLFPSKKKKNARMKSGKKKRRCSSDAILMESIALLDAIIFECWYVCASYYFTRRTKFLSYSSAACVVVLTNF